MDRLSLQSFAVEAQAQARFLSHHGADDDGDGDLLWKSPWTLRYHKRSRILQDFVDIFVTVDVQQLDQKVVDKLSTAIRTILPKRLINEPFV